MLGFPPCLLSYSLLAVTDTSSTLAHSAPTQLPSIFTRYLASIARQTANKTPNPASQTWTVCPPATSRRPLLTLSMYNIFTDSHSLSHTSSRQLLVLQTSEEAAILQHTAIPGSTVALLKQPHDSEHDGQFSLVLRALLLFTRLQASSPVILTLKAEPLLPLQWFLPKTIFSSKIHVLLISSVSECLFSLSL